MITTRIIHLSPRIFAIIITSVSDPACAQAYTSHREYPLNNTLISSHTHEENLPIFMLPTQDAIIFTPNQNNQLDQNEAEALCTNSKAKALATGACVGAAVGLLGFKARKFFPYNWIAAYFLRTLLISALMNPCTAKNKDLMRDSAWTADWLVYSFLWLNYWRLI